MRTLLLLPLFLFACEGKQTIGADSGPIGNDDDTAGGDETDADTDADSDADTDADSDTDTDTDTDTDADTDTTPVEDDLTGNTYAINLADANITEPAGVGSILGSYLTQEILVGVVSASSTELEMMGALSVSDSAPAEQDYCLTSIDFPTADFTGNPDFSIGPTDVTMSVAGYEATLTGFELTGTFAADGSDFHNGTLSASIDTRSLDSAFGGGEGTVCGYAEMFGASCEACPDDGESFCLSLRAEDITGERVDGLTLSEVQGNNCDGCESGPPAPDAVCD